MSHGNTFNRRRFLQSTGLAGAALALPAWFVEEQRSYAAPETPRSPNDKPNIALIGAGGRGRGDAKDASRYGNLVAVCDVDAAHAESAAKQFKGAQAYTDFRKVLERNDIDVIINGTPDHWHTLVNMAAAKAGKDIYSEKPLTLTIDEGRRLVKVIRDSGRILQTGTQQRSDANFRLVCELVLNGRLGKLKQITTWLPAGLREGPFKTAPVPEGLNWDYWQGQTPSVDYVPQRCHTFFRYWYEYSGGTITDWGAHHNDIAFWGTGYDRSGPVAVEAKPLVEMIPGGYTAYSDYRIEYTYKNGLKHVCESERYDNIFGGDNPDTADPPAGTFRHGIKFDGEAGWIFVSRGITQASDPDLLKQPLPSDAKRLYASNNHMGNFFECVKSRKPPICDVEIGHRSASICHLAVISLLLGGRKLKWDPDKEEFVGDAEAQKMVARPMRKPYDYTYVGL
jgi:predicted dehydrogenase